MILERASGILAHPTSFPSPYGIGDLGQSAYDFLDFLHKAEQRLWQILPLGPTSFGDSPYQSFSTFAGNTLLISPDILVKEGYLETEDLENVPEFNLRRVEYGEVIEYKAELYRMAYSRFNVSATAAQRQGFAEFCGGNSWWLEDFALFMALKDYFIGMRREMFESPEFLEYKTLCGDSMSEDLVKDCFYGAAWSSWPKDIREREPAAVREWSALLEDKIKYYKFLQYEFFREWALLREYAAERDIKIIGDIPIFVALDSSDVWSDKALFHLDSHGFPTVVAGVPPDYFSETGQLWGNPIYDWEAHKAQEFDWWICRIRSALSVVDTLRIDHFRGFDAYWEIEFGEPTAINGVWQKGPGTALFDAVAKKLGDLPIIAEDLGLLTDSVLELRDSLNFPGMKVLQFAFDGEADNDFLPHNYVTANSVVYSGTHDNDTSVGWYAGAPDKTRDYFRRYLNVSGENVAWDMIRLSFSSCAAYAVVPLQDAMRLDTDSRMNLPGSAEGNWQFRYTADMLSEDIASGLKYLAGLYNRTKPLPVALS